METFTMPLHEIRDRFTKSELFMVAWRSQEQHFHLKKRMSKFDSVNADNPRNRYTAGDVIPEGASPYIADKVIRDSRGVVVATPGEINLSQVTGKQARKYMAALGIPFPEMGVGKMPV